MVKFRTIFSISVELWDAFFLIFAQIRLKIRCTYTNLERSFDPVLARIGKASNIDFSRWG